MFFLSQMFDSVLKGRKHKYIIAIFILFLDMDVDQQFLGLDVNSFYDKAVLASGVLIEGK